MTIALRSPAEARPSGLAPRVSVVIPTHGRPHLVVKAINSALEQDVEELEVIVIVDGSQPETEASLAEIADGRVRVIVQAQQVGNAEARNIGVRASRARWLAFLDDDDLWLPGKLRAQLTTAEHVKLAYPIVSCRIAARNGREELIWPRRVPADNEHLSEYLFCRKAPFTGEGLIATSSLLAPRDLLVAVPFTTGLKRFVEMDWLLRAKALDGVQVIFPEHAGALAVWNIEEHRSRIGTRQRGWEEALDWIDQLGELTTARARSAFALTIASSLAAGDRDRGAFAKLIQYARRNGGTRPAELLTHLGNFFLPDSLKRVAASLFAGLRQAFTK